MFRPALALCLLVILTSAASAAIVFEPVQYQYRDPYGNAPAFYYGGSDPAVFQWGANVQQRFNMGPGYPFITTSFSREGRFAYNVLNNKMLNLFPHTYTDLLPPGMNAYVHGYSISDARNTAYANVPLYFRKRDLLASAELTPDGHLVVPAQAPGTIEIKPYHGPPTTQPSTAPTTTPSPILIIPKSLLNKPLNAQPKTVAMAK
ncbi:MAG TPA: hypothetical protein VGI81_07350 [Tepidisphaeraceae bacterium]|jgi:hypothetical protein